MIRAVLDTSVIVKSIFKPLRSLSKEAYSREQETHEKCKALIKLIEEQDVEIHVPKRLVAGEELEALYRNPHMPGSSCRSARLPDKRPEK